MQIGTSLFLIATGAVLKYAVTDAVNGVDLSTVGVIFMIVGGVGLLITLLFLGSRRDRGATDGVIVQERREVL